jgi:hypothetical protein
MLVFAISFLAAIALASSESHSGDRPPDKPALYPIISGITARMTYRNMLLYGFGGEDCILFIATLKADAVATTICNHDISS